MGRRALEPGKFGKTTMRGRHPKLGLWRSESSLKQERVRPRLWRAEVRYHDPDEHRVRVLTAEGETKGAASESLEAGMLTIAGKVVRMRGEGRRWDPALKSSLSCRTIPIREGVREALERRVRACEKRDGVLCIFAPPTSPWPNRDVYARQLRGIFDRAGLCMER